ncbi:hypothetical protein IV102_19865 [bacterium]|nr:hypothetical protein [bacterium]
MMKSLLERIRPYSSSFLGLDQSRSFLSDVLVVPPDQAVDEAMTRLNSLLQGGKKVALIGYGVTTAAFERRWQLPDELLRIDLGAFSNPSNIDASRQIRRGIHTWLEHLLPGLSRELYGSACQRLFQKAIEAQLFRQDLMKFAGKAKVHVVGSFWPWGLTWGAAATKAPGWRVRLSLEIGAGLLIVGWRMLSHHWARRSLVARLECGRKKPDQAHPHHWFLLHNEWYRLNSHLVRELALPKLRAGLPIGVLLCGDLVPGARQESDLKVAGSELFSGIGELKQEGNRLVLEQVAWPETLPSLAACYALTCAATVRAGWRALCSSGWRSDSLPLDLSSMSHELAKLLTIDVARALGARQRARSLPLPQGAVIFSSGSSSGGACAADLYYQSQGHATVEFFHGAGAEDWIGAAESPSRRRAVWTQVDARSLQALGQDSRAGGMPWSIQTPAQSPKAGPRRLLLATNYLHRDYQDRGFFPYEYFAHELLDLSIHLDPAQFQIRWRMHPAETSRARSLAQNRKDFRMMLSQTTLQEDLSWCDAVISTMSSVAVEALAYHVPVFLHVLPRFAATAYAQAFGVERRFFSASEGAQKILACFSSGSIPSDEPEKSARHQFFGPGARPADFESILRWAESESHEV